MSVTLQRFLWACAYYYVEFINSLILDQSLYSLEILAFPFENDEIDISKCKETIEKVEKQEGKKIHIMEKVNINGPDTHPIYAYLKKLFDMESMDPNFAHYL